MADFVEGLGKLGDPVKTVGGVDISALPLTVQQGFVLSRVDGASSAKILCQISGLGEQATLEILKQLRAQGLIVVGDEAPQRPAEPASGNSEPKAGAKTSASREVELPPMASQEIEGPPTRSQELRALEDLEITAEDEAELAREDEVGEIDLKREVRVRVRALHARIDDLNFFELLGVEVDANEKTVRRAYFKRSKQFHPDRFYTKNCGHYKDKLARIFKQITSAYEFLQEDDKRAEYQQMILREREEEAITRKLANEVARAEGVTPPHDTPSQPMPARSQTGTTYSYVKFSKSDRKKRRRRRASLLDAYQPQIAAAEARAGRESDEFAAAHEGRSGSSAEHEPEAVEQASVPVEDDARSARREEDRRRRRRMTGLGEIQERQQKAKGFYDKGIKQLEEGKTLAAAASLKLAVTYDPSVPEYRERYDEAVDASREVTAEGFYKRALFEEGVGRIEAAAKLFVRAAEVLDSALYLTRACDAAREMGDLEKALEYGTHAVQKDPGSVAARIAISRACLAHGDKQRAKHEVEMALKLAPADADAKDLLRRIRRA